MKDKADAVILIGEEQTKEIARGLNDVGLENVYIENNMASGLKKALEITSIGDTVLIENDLPSVFYSKSDLMKGGK